MILNESQRVLTPFGNAIIVQKAPIKLDVDIKPQLIVSQTTTHENSR